MSMPLNDDDDDDGITQLQAAESPTDNMFEQYRTGK